jgi:enamine deaminase RidA (YjgF/YER057c/UK114 family)
VRDGNGELGARPDRDNREDPDRDDGGDEKGRSMARRVINPWTWQDVFGFVQAHEVSGAQRVLHVAGQTSVDAYGGPMHPGDMAAQVEQAIDNLEVVLREADMALEHVVRINYYTTDVDLFLEAGAASLPRLQKAGCRPASTLLGVQRLAFPELMIEIEATAIAEDDGGGDVDVDPL